MMIRLQILSMVVLYSLGTFLLSACGSTKPPAPNPVVPITTDTAKEENVSFTNIYPGKVVPLKQVDIHADVSGYVTAILFKDGQKVRAGQPLYEIDKRRYQATYDQALASLHTAEANLLKDQQDVERYTRLFQQDAVAKQKLDYSVSAQKSDSAQVESAKAAMASAETDLHYATIVAPFSGTIGISQVRLGAVATSGSTLLNTISSDNPMAIDFNLDEKQIPDFERSLSKYGHVDSLFTLYMPDQTRYPAFGNYFTRDRAVDPQMGTITVRLTCKSVDSIPLVAGQSMNVKVLSPNAGGRRIVIPMIAAKEEMSEYFVFVVKDTIVQEQKVKLGNRNGGTVVVLDGLKEGDVIAKEGIEKLHDKSVVKIKSLTP